MTIYRQTRKPFGLLVMKTHETSIVFNIFEQISSKICSTIENDLNFHKMMCHRWEGGIMQSYKKGAPYEIAC